MILNMWNFPWWKLGKGDLNYWVFWSDPYGYLRVTDPKKSQIYIYERPPSSHEKILKEKGWKRDNFNPHYITWTTQDLNIVKETTELLNLQIPIWESNHCVKIYWHQFNYVI